MDKEFIDGLMEGSMWEDITKIKNKALESILGLMVGDMKVTGKMERETVQEK
jgi:hypothetical protein